jgi:hypothetical protein
MNPVARFCLLIIPLALSCSGNLQTFSDRHTKADLNQYKSYAWLAPGDTVLNAERKDKLYGNFIVQTADTELKKKGMSVDIRNPDALFVFETKIEEKAKYTRAPVVGVGVGLAGPGYYVGGAAPIAGGELLSSTYEEGLLYFNMHDTKTGKLIWSGGATKPLKNSDNVEQIIKAAVKNIFKELPIKHKTK